MSVRAAVSVLALAALALCQQPTRVSVEQVGNDAAMQAWPWAPPSAKAGCVLGAFASDDQYRVYLCVPDRRYGKAGHTPYVWVRLVPDPTFIPAGYLP